MAGCPGLGIAGESTMAIICSHRRKHALLGLIRTHALIMVVYDEWSNKSLGIADGASEQEDLAQESKEAIQMFFLKTHEDPEHDLGRKELYLCITEKSCWPFPS
jgi:hypothetical protein